MATIDSLDIQISASVQRAIGAIDNLNRKLGNLQSSLRIDASGLEKLGNVNGSNIQKLGIGLNSYSTAVKRLQGVKTNAFTNLANGMSKLAGIDASKLQALSNIDFGAFQSLGNSAQSLATGLKALEGVRQSDFNKLASGMGRLAAVQPGNMQAVAASIGPLAQGVQALSNVNFDNKNLQNLINSLARLSNANVASLSGVDFTRLGESIKSFANAASGADKVPQSVISLTNAVAKLAQAGGNIGTVTAQLPYLGKALKQLMKSMSGLSRLAPSTVSFTQAIASLANAGSKAGTTAASLDALGRELKKLFSTMSTAPTISRNTIQMTQALSSLTSSGRRMGSSFGGLGKSLSAYGKVAEKSARHTKGLASQFASLYVKLRALSGAFRLLKKATESAMDYVETLNYFNAAFQQVAENADLSGWEEAGSKSAEAYANSFKERAKQLTQKLTGFEVSDTGELTRTTMPSLGLDPDKTMQYQATFAQMTSSMGATSEAAVKVSNALTMIGADLASVRNLDFDRVWEDMASGLAGMSRTLDKYGVNIRNVNLQQKLNSLGINESIMNINQQDKALLRTIILLESTKYAWGDLAETINDSSTLSLVA